MLIHCKKIKQIVLFTVKVANFGVINKNLNSPVMKRKILHNFLRLLVFGFITFPFGKVRAQTVDILGNPGTSQNIITGSNAYHLSECIYLESEIGATNFLTAATAINHIEVNVNTAQPLPVPDSFGLFAVYMKEVPAATTTFVAGVYNKTGYTLVYSGSLKLTATDWKGIDLQTPFMRTSGNNLSVMFERLDGVARTTPVTFASASGNANSPTATSTRRYNNTTLPVIGTTSLATSTFRAAIRLAHTNPIDAGITNFVSPASSCFTSAQNIGVTISNLGTTATFAAGTASVALTISGANTYTATVTNTTALSPGGFETVNFAGINLPNIGANVIRAVVTYSGDPNPANDTLFSGLSNTTTTTIFPAMEGAENTPFDYFQYLKIVNGTQAWGLQTGKIKNTNLTDSLAPHGGNRFYIFDSYNVQNSDVILHSNCLSLPPAGGNNNFYVSFWMSHDTSYSNGANTFLDSMYLVISTDKGATWTRLAGYQRNGPNYVIPGWGNHQVDIPAYAGQTIQIGFEGVSKYGNLIGLDDITIVADGLLPVSLLNFSGERVGASNQLSWATASETNNTGFELQRSADGSNFSKLSFVATKSEGGNSNRNLKYDFTDTKPYATSNYYRLKQIDKDGKFSYSNIVLVKGTKSASLSIASIYPNPAVNNLRLAIASPSNEKVTLVVTDLAGRILMQNSTQLVAGDNNLQLNVKGLAKGSYSIKVVCNNGCNSEAVRFVKQ